MVTAIEGNKMAKAGKAAQALATAAIGSFVAGTIGTLLLVVTAPLIVKVAVGIGAQDYFAIMVLAFVAVTAVLGASRVRGFASLAIGLTIGLVGIDSTTGQQRLTFGLPLLADGIDVVVVAVGIFAVGEALWVAAHLRRTPAEIIPVGRAWMGKEDWKRSWKPWLRGTAFGFPFGALPAGGAEIPTFLSYVTEKKLSKHPEEFGHGAIEGVAGPEASNNASAAGTLVPMLALGLPVSATAAVMLAAFQSYGIQPGPLLFDREPELVWGLIASLFIGNALLLILNLPLAPFWAKLLSIPRPVPVRRDPVLRQPGRLRGERPAVRPGPAAGPGSARVRHAPLRAPGPPGDHRGDPRPARGAAAAARPADLRWRVERTVQQPARDRHLLPDRADPDLAADQPFVIRRFRPRPAHGVHTGHAHPLVELAEELAAGTDDLDQDESVLARAERATSRRDEPSSPEKAPDKSPEKTPDKPPEDTPVPARRLVAWLTTGLTARPRRHPSPAAPEPPAREGRSLRFLFTGEGWPYLLVPLIPVAVVLELVHAEPTWVFLASALGVIPTAALMGRATEELAARSGPGIGGFLNVTFGNAPELIIALFALGAGLHEVVKASIVGSILGNILLVLGVSMLAGGLRRERQNFEPRAASAQALLLLLATVALIMPAIFELVQGPGLPSPRDEAVAYPADVLSLSVGVAIVLLVSYGAGLLFSLKTHAHLFNPAHDEDDHGGEPWTVRRSVIMLAVPGSRSG